MSKEENLILFPEVEILARRLSHEQFGRLILAVMAYSFREEPYDGEDPLIGMAFDIVANQVDRGRAVSKDRARAAKSRWEKNAENCKTMQTDANDAPVQPSPVQTSPIQSGPDQPSPAQSDEKNPEDNHCCKKGKASPGAAAPSPMKKISFGKFGWVKLSRAEHEQLEYQLGREELQRCIDYLDEACQKTGNKNRWKDFGLVIQKCAQEGWGKHSYGYRNSYIPKGASGVIGEAEMEFIRNAMKEENDDSGTP